MIQLQVDTANGLYTGANVIILQSDKPSKISCVGESRKCDPFDQTISNVAGA